MKKTKIILIIILTLCTLTSCVNQNEKTSYEITDLRNRTTLVPDEVNRVVCIGASALRLYSYVGDLTKLVGVEEFEKGQTAPVRPYSYAYQDFFMQLPSIGAGGPNASYDAEAIMKVTPDVIFSLYDDVDGMNNLAKRTGIPVVCLSYGGSDPFSEQVYQSLNLIGKIVHNENRASQVINYIKEIKSDLNNRTKAIKDEDKPTVYLGNNTYNRGKGTFGDTLVNYACFREINAKSVLADMSFPTNNPTLDYETLLRLNPDLVFIDIANVPTLQNEYEQHKAIFSKLQAFQNQQVYLQMPFNQYYTNLEIALADAYYIGKVVFPDAFVDIDVTSKFNEICSTMLNKEFDYYQKVTEYFGRGFGQLTLS